MFLCTLYLDVGSASSNKIILFFNSGFLLKLLFSVTRFLKTVDCHFWRICKGFNLSAGSLVRLPKDCDARLTPGPNRLALFTQTGQSRPGESSAIVGYIKEIHRQSKLSTPTTQIVWCNRLKSKRKPVNFQSLQIATMPPHHPSKAKYSLYIWLLYDLFVQEQDILCFTFSVSYLSFVKTMPRLYELTHSNHHRIVRNHLYLWKLSQRRKPFVFRGQNFLPLTPTTNQPKS